MNRKIEILGKNLTHFSKFVRVIFDHVQVKNLIFSIFSNFFLGLI